jgi:aldose 1-epimerase
VTAALIPTGELRDVAGTPFDFRKARRIGEQIDCSDEQIGLAHGYDHNWVIDVAPGVLSRSATVYEPESGRLLDVFSTQPGLQFYSGNFLDGTIVGKQGWRYQRHSGFCLEPQHFPDSPNRPEFPSVVLRPGQEYKSTIGYRFTVRSGVLRIPSSP